MSFIKEVFEQIQATADPQTMFTEWVMNTPNETFIRIMAGVAFYDSPHVKSSRAAPSGLTPVLEFRWLERGVRGHQEGTVYSEGPDGWAYPDRSVRTFPATVKAFEQKIEQSHWPVSFPRPKNKAHVYYKKLRPVVLR